MPVQARTVVAATVGALTPALLWSLPYMFFGAFLPGLMINLAIWVPVFAISAVASYIMLRSRPGASLRDRLRAVFWITSLLVTAARLAILQWAFHGGGEEFHFDTVVVQNGRVTFGGVLLTLLESMILALPVVAGFALFWRLAARRAPELAELTS